MSDIHWFIVVGILFVLLGFLFLTLGRKIRKDNRIDLIISHHVEKVREENKQAYCRLAGTGVLLMGIGFLLSGILSPFVRSALSFVPMGAGLVLGIAFLVSAGRKYNR
ncbi:MAG: DUF3784 domain-containing protein [Erysipelotrichales bacterium]|nr:DUF3784 domain-containing protein [Erysipelotrichales bacterium]MBQ2310468.1 DUF3784 domain-containing protein [Erysipelotrichales bacterium]MBQ2478042.1 DUF3784 domain-containing protein [Erysipelotrichales bacterium]MBQ4374634.1 DUF3784 domain-containing protein [Erysipelotrichales bacterium]